MRHAAQVTVALVGDGARRIARVSLRATRDSGPSAGPEQLLRLLRRAIDPDDAGSGPDDAASHAAVTPMATLAAWPHACAVLAVMSVSVRNEAPGRGPRYAPLPPAGGGGPGAPREASETSRQQRRGGRGGRVGGDEAGAGKGGAVDWRPDPGARVLVRQLRGKAGRYSGQTATVEKVEEEGAAGMRAVIRLDGGGRVRLRLEHLEPETVAL